MKNTLPERVLEIFNGQPLGANFSPGSIERSLEDIELRGFTILKDEFNLNLKLVRDEIDKLYLKEVSDFGLNNLKEINDVGVLRNPIFNSKLLREVAFHENFMNICAHIFGHQFILHVNRAVISDVEYKHPASVWHREPPYQNYITNKPVALTMIYLPDGSNAHNSGIEVLPGSHKWVDFPSDEYVLENAITPTILPGEAIVINSSLLHKGGIGANERRRSLVTIFSSPLIKQQTDIAAMVGLNYPSLLEEFAAAPFLYGVTTKIHASDNDYRLNKLNSKVKINEKSY